MRIGLLALFIQGLEGRVVIQILFHAGIGGAVRFGEQLLQGFLLVAVVQRFELFIIVLNLLRVILGILLQARHVGAFVFLGAGDETRVDPLVDHIVGAHGVLAVRGRQRVNETAAFCRHVYVALFGDDGADPHIPFTFLHIYMLVGRGVHAGGVFALAAVHRLAGIDDDGLFGRHRRDCPLVVLGFLKDTDVSVGAGQGNLLALYRDGIGSLIGYIALIIFDYITIFIGNFFHVLDNVALGFQGHIAHFLGCRRFAAVIRFFHGNLFADQLLDHHIAGQGLAVRLAAHHFHVDVAAVGRDRSKLNPVPGNVGGCSCAIPVIRSNRLARAHGRDVDAFNILFCLQVGLARGHGFAALHADAAAGGFHRHGGVPGGALDIALQVNVATFRAGILYGDAAVAVAAAQKAYGDGFVCLHGEGVGLGGSGLDGPGGMVLGI